jgi:MATE family multidrug resistance protein
MAQSAGLGDLMLAVNTILIQFRHLSAHALDGFATAAEVLVGAAVGSGKRDDLLRAISLSRRWGLLVGWSISLIFLTFSPWMPALFTRNPEVLALARVYIWWVVLDPLLNNIPFILDGVFVGATATRTMRNAMLVSVFAVYLPVFFVFQWAWGNHGMWAATLILYGSRGLTLSVPVHWLRTRPGYRLN